MSPWCPSLCRTVEPTCLHDREIAASHAHNASTGSDAYPQVCDACDVRKGDMWPPLAAQSSGCALVPAA
eukprot:88720-Chlamydomonas_euryale.AAC.1